MDDIPVKISETCRPPVRVHLPAAFRQLPPLSSHQFTLSTERNILHWITERRKNFVDQRHERQRRLHAKQEAAELRAAASSSSSGGGATVAAAAAVNGECCDTVAPLAPPLVANGGCADGGEIPSPPAQQPRLPPAVSRHSQSEQSASSSRPVHAGAESVRDAENVSVCPEASAACPGAPSAAVAAPTAAAADDDGSDKTLASGNATGDGGAAAAAAVTTNGVTSVGVSSAVASGGGGARVGLCINGVAGGASHNSPDSVRSDVGAVASTNDTAVATAILPVTTNTHHQNTNSHTPVSLHKPPAISSYTALSNSPVLPNSLGLHSAPALPGSAAFSQVSTSVHSAAVAQSVAPSPSVLSPQPPPPPVEAVSQCGAVLLPVTGAASSAAASVSVAPLSAAQPTVAPTAAATTAVVFNVAEFESQASDPFDSAQLRSLDDMKELAAIFQRSAALASAGGESNGGSQQHHHHQQQRQQQPSVAAPPATHPQLLRLGAASGTVAVGTARTTGAAGLSSVPGASHYAVPVRRPCVSVAPVAQLAPMRGANTSGPGAVCCAPPALPQQQQQQHQQAAAAAPAGNTVGGGGGGVSCRDPAELRALQDFYTRYYQPISGPPLRSCRSVPDLADPGATNSTGAVQSHSIRPSPPRHPFSDGSSHAGTLSDRLSPETPAEVTAASCGVDEATFRRLRQISAMGFPVQRLIRFHKHFGGDEKKVIDGALVARSLQGQYPEPIVELAVCEQGSSQLQHVLAYCHLLHQLHSCGFRLQRVAAVLRHTGLDQERALDALLTD